MPPIEPLIRAAATVTAGLFAGSVLMEALVHQRARIAAPPRICLDQMQRVLARADPYMPLLAAASFVACALSGAMTKSPASIAAAVCFGVIFPLSGFAIRPVNLRIRSADLDQTPAPVAIGLVRRWGRLHLLRGGAGILGFAILALGQPL